MPPSNLILHDPILSSLLNHIIIHDLAGQDHVVEAHAARNLELEGLVELDRAGFVLLQEVVEAQHAASRNLELEGLVVDRVGFVLLLLA
jgi:ABC-type transporter Mla MlaB component